MTLTSTTTKKIYNGDGSTTSFAVSFVFWLDADVKVIHTDSSGTETTWTKGTQYTLTGGSGATGTVTVSTSPVDYTPASGETLTVKSALDDTQDTSLPLGGDFPSATVEERLDKITRLIQQRSEELGRSVKLNETSSASEVFIADPVTGEYLRWKADGSIESAALADSTTAQSVDETDTDTTKDKLTSNSLENRFHTVIPDKATLLSRGSDTINNGFVHREAFRVSVTSWATQMTLTPNAANNSGFNGYVRAVLSGHTNAIGDGTIIAEWQIEDSDQPAEVRKLEYGSSPPGFRITASSDVQTIQIQSSNGVAEFRGILQLEVYIPRDFNTGDGTTWTIS